MGKISSDLLLTNSNNPKLNIVTHGSYTKQVLEFLNKYAIEAELLIVSELYGDNKLISKLNDNRLPLCIIEEKNSNFGALATMVSRELMSNNYKGTIHINSSVECIPANQQWESNLMLNFNELESIVNEALK